MCEVWDAQNQSFRVDLYSVPVQADGVFDLRPPEIQASLELSKDCFGLANPPQRQYRDYVAWQHLAYVIWSAGFNGVIWKSVRYAGDSLCLYRPGKNSSIGPAHLLERNVNVEEWLSQNP